MPRLSRGHYRRELVAWFFLPIMLGAVEGGIVGVLAKNIFETAASTRALNLCVAVLAGAPAFANVTSFIWAALSHGRHKIRFARRQPYQRDQASLRLRPLAPGEAER